MTSDRMMQAIGRIERAIARLETATGRGRDQSARQSDEIGRLRAALQQAEARNDALTQELEQQQELVGSGPQAAFAHADPDGQAPDPHAMNPFSHDKALAALRSLDSLIDDLQKARRDG
ncbi:hypothetical protein LWE61_10450 [Sphingobium sufflavum]|uniref:hypothetical protein n=1 Tax=Sphingobium sufflavum TaxID=1129547 RepID=UPI001F3320BC|nr:hypothetical protein [Sphingobium sufflavum]MCE7796978.1 hypothetical protein [Sphingobium sufflavum]